MTRSTSAALAAACLALLGTAAACSGDDANAAKVWVELDGSPRPPDDEGVVTAIADDFSTITIDGERTYEISDTLQSFSTTDGSTQPLLRRLRQYVHVGLEGGTAVWVAGIAAVVDTGEPLVFYRGEVSALRGGRSVAFTDGTVLRIADGVTLPKPGDHVLATIDATRDVVVELSLER